MQYKNIGIILLLTTVVLFLGFNRITTIECKVDSNSCTDQLNQKAQSLQGTSFFFTDFEKFLITNQDSDSIYLLDSVQKKLPNTVFVHFTQEELKYLLQISDTKIAIGKSGKKLENYQNTDSTVQIIWQNQENIIEDTIVLEKYHKQFMHIAQVLSKSQNKDQKVIWTSDEEIFLEINNKPTFIFDILSLETQLKKVDTILNARELDEIQVPIKEIDMRFELPVLRTNQ